MFGPKTILLVLRMMRVSYIWNDEGASFLEDASLCHALPKTHYKKTEGKTMSN